MTGTQPDRLRKIQADLVDISGRLNTLASDFQQLAAALPQDLQQAGVGAPPIPQGRPAAAPAPSQGAPQWSPPGQYAPPQSQPQLQRPASYPVPNAARQAAPVMRPAVAPAARPAYPVAPRKPRRQVSVAEIFSVVGSGITLLGVAFVLLLPADGFLGPLQRAGIGLGLAVIAVLVALWQHRAEPGNIGSQALMATGVASAFLSVFALSSLFHGADGNPLLPPLAGLTIAGLISLGGVTVARWWRSQWLAVLAVLGSLILAPYLGGDQPMPTMAFMLVMTLVTAAFQHKLDWVGLLLARVLPTVLYFVVVLAPRGQYELMSNPLIGLGLAFLLAAGGLGIAVLHQEGSARMRTIAVASMVAMTAPMMLAIWTPEKYLSVALAGVLGGIFVAVGLLSKVFSPSLRSAAVPLGAVFVMLAVVRFTDGDYLGYVLFALAAAYFAIAASTKFKPVMVVAWLLAWGGLMHWLPAMTAAFAPWTAFGAERVAESLLGLVTTLLAVRALRAFRDKWGSGLTYVSWAASVGFGSVAVIQAGSVIGERIGHLYTGFQAAHAVVTVAWLLLSVLLLRMGLRRNADNLVSVRLAIALAAAAVAKLFFFDLSTLPDLVRALAFLAVGVLMLIIGTWYHKQLDKVRKASDPAGQVSAPAAPPVPSQPPVMAAPAAESGVPGEQGPVSNEARKPE